MVSVGSTRMRFVGRSLGLTSASEHSSANRAALSSSSAVRHAAQSAFGPQHSQYRWQRPAHLLICTHAPDSAAEAGVGCPLATPVFRPERRGPGGLMPVQLHELVCATGPREVEGAMPLAPPVAACIYLQRRSACVLQTRGPSLECTPLMTGPLWPRQRSVITCRVQSVYAKRWSRRKIQQHRVTCARYCSRASASYIYCTGPHTTCDGLCATLSQ